MSSKLNIKEAVNKYMEEHASMQDIVNLIVKNFGDCWEEDGSLTVYIEELVDCHYGVYKDAILCNWFGFKFPENMEQAEDMAGDDWEVVRDTAEECKDAMCTWLTEHLNKEEFDGSFFIADSESDGAMTLFYTEDMKELSFSTWRKDNGYRSWDSFRDIELCNGRDEDDIREEYANIIEEFEQHCEDYHYIPYKDED
jgi:hypothetical protein